MKRSQVQVLVPPPCRTARHLAVAGHPTLGDGTPRPRPGALAQLVERLLCKQDVRSSNLLGSTVSPRLHSVPAAPGCRPRSCVGARSIVRPSISSVVPRQRRSECRGLHRKREQGMTKSWFSLLSHNFSEVTMSSDQTSSWPALEWERQHWTSSSRRLWRVDDDEPSLGPPFPRASRLSPGLQSDTLDAADEAA